MEAHYLWFVQLVPRVLSDLVNGDSFVRICYEYSSYHVLGVVR